MADSTFGNHKQLSCVQSNVLDATIYQTKYRIKNIYHSHCLSTKSKSEADLQTVGPSSEDIFFLRFEDTGSDTKIRTSLYK